MADLTPVATMSVVAFRGEEEVDELSTTSGFDGITVDVRHLILQEDVQLRIEYDRDLHELRVIDISDLDHREIVWSYLFRAPKKPK